jgi:hypothetical protein
VQVLPEEFAKKSKAKGKKAPVKKRGRAKDVDSEGEDEREEEAREMDEEEGMGVKEEVVRVFPHFPFFTSSISPKSSPSSRR